MITDSFYKEKCGSLERARNVWKTLNLDCQDDIRFGIFQVDNHLGRVSSSHFLQNVLIETLNVCFKNFLSCTLPFLNVMKFRRFKKTLKDILSLTIANRGGICICKACL